MTQDALLQLVDLFENTDALVFVFDPEDRLRIANAAFRSALHVGPEEQPTWSELMRRNYANKRGSRILTDDFDAWHMSTLSRRGKMPSRTIEVDLHDGRWFTMTETVLDDGWMLCIANDVTHLKASSRSLRVDRDDAQKAAQTDDLTGISNRRHIMELLENQLTNRSATVKGAGFACLLDIDHFKAVNDQFGHLAGDEVLRRFAETVRAAIPSRDSVGRVGGEEFLVILGTHDATEAKSIVDGILDAVRAAPVLASQPSYRVSTSAGVARIDPSLPGDTIYSRCDVALYHAKDGGRDRVYFET